MCSLDRQIITPQPGPAGPVMLNGSETLDYFVRVIRLREKARAKRQSLPDIAPIETDAQDSSSIMARLKISLFS